MTERHQILTVEDSPTQALRLQMDLEAHDWNVVTVGTADEALRRLDRSPPDVMIVDYCLPGMRGDELCRRVRMNINTRAIPIIMLTADESEETEVRGLDSGADDFFKKSTDTDILVIRIRTMIERPQRDESFVLHGENAFRRAWVLAVDDSATYLSHLSCLLQEEGYTVDTVADPKQALSRLETSAYDLALVDLVMPQLDGIELCRRIVAMRTSLDNPIAVLMLTGRRSERGLDARSGSGRRRLRRQIQRPGRSERANPCVAAPQVLSRRESAHFRGIEEQRVGGGSRTCGNGGRSCPGGK